MIEYLYCEQLALHGIQATDKTSGLTVAIKKGWKFALGDNVEPIKYTHIRRLNGDGSIDHDPATPLLESIGVKASPVGRATIEIRLARVTTNEHGLQEWTFLNKDKWKGLGFNPPEEWLGYGLNSSEHNEPDAPSPL